MAQFLPTLLLFLLALVFPAGGLNAQTLSADLAREGSICRRLAEARDLDSDLLSTACEKLKLASQAPSPSPEIHQTLKSCEALLDVAKESHASAKPLTFLLRADTTVFEENDSPVDLALERAFEELVPKVRRLLRPNFPVIARCTGSVDSCTTAREDLLRLTRNDVMTPIYPDELYTAGVSEEQIGQPGSVPSASAVPALKRDFGWSNIMIVDIHIEDEVLCPPAVSYVELIAWEWSLDDGQLTGIGQADDVAVDARPWRLMAGFNWFALFGLLALSSLVSPLFLKQPISMSIAGAAGLGFAITMTASVFVLPNLEAIGPGLNDHGLSPSGDPLFALLLWPGVVGCLVYVAPVVLSKLFSMILSMKYVNFTNYPVNPQAFIPISVASLATALTLPLSAQTGLDGVAWSFWLIVPPTIASIALASMLSEMEHNKDDHSSTYLGSAALLCALSIYLPICAGAPPAYLIGVPTIVLSLVVWQASRTLSAKSSQQVEEAPITVPIVEATSAGSLLSPLYTAAPETSRDFRFQFEKHPNQTFLIRGPSQSGKSRWAKEAGAGLHRTGTRLVEVRGCGFTNDLGPYATLSDLLRPFIDILQSVEYNQKKADHHGAAVPVAAEILGGLPGIGILLGLAGDPPNNITQEWIADDICNALTKATAHQSLLLVVDDIQDADTESLVVLERVFNRLENQRFAHPLQWVFTEQTSDNIADESEDSSHPLQKIKKHCIVLSLEKMDTDLISVLISKAGLSAPEDVAKWMHESVGATHPGEVLSLASHLESIGLVESHNGERRICSVEQIRKVAEEQKTIPNSLLEREKHRLGMLPHSQLFLLEMAAQCGRRFTARGLSAGLGRKAIDVLQELRELEETNGLVQDAADEDVFWFNSDSTRQALLALTQCRATEDASALTREFHFQVVQALSRERNTNSDIDSATLLFHANRSGRRLFPQAAQYALEASEESARMFDWVGCIGFIQQAKELFGQVGTLSNPETLDRLNFVEGLALKGRGGQENRDQSWKLLKMLQNSPFVDRYEVLLNAIEVRYEEKTETETKELQNFVQELLSSEPEDSPVHPLLQFYEALLFYKPAQLEPLEVRLQDGPKGTRTALLLSRVRLERANMRMFWKIKPEEKKWAVSNSELHQLLQQSLSLKKKLQDLPGQAMVEGVIGNIYLFRGDDSSVDAPKVKEDLEKAQSQFEKSLKIADQIGEKGQRPVSLNKLGEAKWGLAQFETEEHRVQQLKHQSVEHCQKSHDLAKELTREGDLLFSAINVVYFGAKLGSTHLEGAFQSLNDDAVWEEIRKKATFIAKISAAISDLGESHPASLQLIEIRDRYTQKEESTT